MGYIRQDEGQRKQEHLLVIHPFEKPTEWFEHLHRKYPDLKITWYQPPYEDRPWMNPDEVPVELFRDATILLTRNPLPPLPKYAPKLDLIQFTFAGISHIKSAPILTETSIPVTDARGIVSPQIAEWVVMTALTHAHHYDMLKSWQLQNQWAANSSGVKQLFNVHDKPQQRVGILGYGSIGRQVGRAFSGLGAQVLAFTAHPKDTPGSRKDNGFIVRGTGDPDGTFPSAWFSGTDKKSLHHFLGQDLDHLVITLPYTKMTRGLIGEEELNILSKRNAFVSNISHGQIVHEAALINALKDYADSDIPEHNPFDPQPSSSCITEDSGFDLCNLTLDERKPRRRASQRPGIRGAALDHTSPEPPSRNSPLWSAPNIFVSPHVAGLCNRYLDRTYEILEINLDRRQKGIPYLNLVNREEGY
ncbi:MAG: hypothetical protein Q9167_006207 [Letrouitia subvulpina]